MNLGRLQPSESFRISTSSSSVSPRQQSAGESTKWCSKTPVPPDLNPIRHLLQERHMTRHLRCHILRHGASEQKAQQVLDVLLLQPQVFDSL